MQHIANWLHKHNNIIQDKFYNIFTIRITYSYDKRMYEWVANK